MISRLDRGFSACVLAVAMIATGARCAVAADTVKVAFWNMMSGQGVDALPGHDAPFIDTSNCTDTAQPLNAWGVGATQAQLDQIASDPALVAIGVSEAWACASKENIREHLGWASTTDEQNGVSLIAKFGFAGPEQWQQLDTSLNTNPDDTAWVVSAPVCLDAACSQSMLVFVAHWYGTGPNETTSYETQALQTATFVTTIANGQPLVLVGDLNVWEGAEGVRVCGQTPTNTALPYLRSAGYIDAWVTVNGDAEGYTGMVDRAGCGDPEGYAWKRIDYAWTPGWFQPIDIQRFARLPVGDASPSDHYGIVVTLPNPYGATAPPTTVWTSLVNATADGATLQKTSGCDTCFDAGAIGTQPVVADGSITFSVGTGQRLFAGLGADQSASTSYLIDYAFSFWPNGAFEIREKNVYRTEGTYVGTDTFTVAIEGMVVNYYQNGALVYTSQTPVSCALVFDTSLASIGATVQILSPGP